ncbi:MMPL family transporter [methanotrophic endosymbiont of Bathymodiolus puteoserpentis (Logatchev)]|uniref:MMPL family transporter n=1 Tax=methanotrophic endosymbiont of Bathymodiolus puteoserpentis (Logatchev) TaxID=343235 RepID=UPI0013C75A4D|nr:MMPL family transporter [methanotrophic endosymbiont of Bathymodiolus puteoserpentis (Logatchev)]SHE21687.1 Hopanoid-associated RND transporter, HpnN [methanotrophic endosymbiont of Bathymodiolus puteoserpentis (Logatchev)]
MSRSAKILEWLGHFIVRYAWLLVISTLLLSSLSLYYVKDHLGVNNNSAEMLSPDLPFQKDTKRFDTAFPQNADTIIFIVEAATPEETAIASKQLLNSLKNSSHYFESSYIPEDNAFFRQQALLYLSPEELENLASNLTDAQPFIGYLTQNYSLTGLFTILTQALEQQDSVISQSLPALLNSINQAIINTIRNQSYHVSWQTILNPSKLANKTRRIVIAKPKRDFYSMMPAAAAVKKAREITAQLSANMANLKIGITGDVVLQHEELESIGDGAVLSGIGSFILVFLILFRCFHSFKLLFATIITLLIGLSLTAGFAAIAIGHLNVISISFAALYIGLGVDFAIHVCLHYREGIAQKHSHFIAIKKALHSVGFSLFLCALTTSIAFFAFVPTDYKGVSELGLISGVSMFISLGLSLVFLPALLSLLNLKKAHAFENSNQTSWIKTVPLRYKKTIRSISILLAIACLFAIPYITFDSNPVDMRNPNSPSVIAFKNLLKSTTDSPYALNALCKNIEETHSLVQKLKQLPTVSNTVTLTDLVPSDQEDKLFTIEDLNMILGPQLSQFDSTLAPSDTPKVLSEFQNTLSSVLKNNQSGISAEILQALSHSIGQYQAALQQSTDPAQLNKRLDDSILGLLPHTISTLSQSLTAYEFNLDSLPDYIRNQWLSPTGIYRVMILPKQDLNIPANLKQFALDVQSVAPAAVGLPVGDLASGQAVVNAFKMAFSFSFALITILLLLILKSLYKTLLVLGPLILASLLTCSVNVLLGIPFNFANIIALPLLLGMGVDSGIHIMHCLHEQLEDNQHILQSSTARGVMFSSITTMSSFISLALIPHFGIASMGITLAVGISFTLICTLIVLPAFSNKTITL